MREKIDVHDFDGPPQGPAVDNTNVGAYLSRLIRAAKPPVITAGGAYNAPVNGTAWKVLPEDADLLAKTASVRLKDEKLIQLMARTGIGLHQLRTLTPQEIEHFCAVAVANADDISIPVTFVEPVQKKMPKTFLMDTWA